MSNIRNFKKSIRKLSKYIKPYKLSFVGAILFIIISAIINAVSPKVEGLILTQLVEDSMDIIKGVEKASVNFDYILNIVIVLIIIYLLYSCLTCLSGFMMTNAIQNSMKDLRNSIQNKIKKLPIEYFDKSSKGDILSRITNDVDTISNAMQQSFNQIINAILSIVLAIAMMISINLTMTCIAIMIMPISYLVSKFIIKKSQKSFKRQQNSLGNLNGKVQEIYTGFNEVKLYGKEKDAFEEFKIINNDLCINGFKAQFLSSIMMPLVGLISYLGCAAMALIGPIYVIKGLLTVGNFQAFIRYIWQINQPLSQITQLSSVIQSAFAAMDRIFEFLEEEEIEEKENSIKLTKVFGNVTFSHVKFGYSKDKVLIEDLNLEIKSGQMVAIVGPTGAGKTTLINLLMRFYDVKEGEIKIDGVNIKEMKRKDLRSIFALVLQDTWLFNGTIYDNIKYGKLDATKGEIIKASKTANAHHFIKTFSDGYNMVVNEEASNISQGEKQLLTIARAILSNPSILILDEATSSVDTRLELLIQKAMKNVMKGRTSFVIAHRLSTIKNADLILVMNDGEIIEQGTHTELMAKGGFYENLYNSQFQH